MKTSFYFVLWILVYPILDLVGISADNSFIVALLLIWLISYLLNRQLRPIIYYNQALYVGGILRMAERGNLEGLRKKIRNQVLISAITATYMAIMTAVLIIQVIESQNYDIIPLIIFGLITVAEIWRLKKALQALHQNDIDNTLVMGFNIRPDNAFADAPLPPRPRRYSAYLAVSTIFAVLSALLGLAGIIIGILFSFKITSTPLQGMYVSIYYLYGGLALYFGIYDTINTLSAQKHNIAG